MWLSEILSLEKQQNIINYIVFHFSAKFHHVLSPCWGVDERESGTSEVGPHWAVLHGPWPALKTASHLVIYFLLSVKNAILKRAQPIQGQAENHQNSTVAITDVGKRALVTGEVDSDVVEEAAKAWDYRGGELMAVYNALGLQREKKELGSKVEKRIPLKPCRSHQYFDQFGIVCKQFLICKKKGCLPNIWIF